jgi:hypothetical protein
VLDADYIEFLFDQCLRLVLLKAQFGLAMDGAAQFDDALARRCRWLFDHFGPLRRQYEPSLRAKAPKQ